MEELFVSPEPIYARVKEELRSYFNTGAIDDLLFGIWTKDCLDKFQNTYLPLVPAVLDMWNHTCELPCDFKSVREVYLCGTYHKGPITSPHVFYYQTDCRIDPAPLQGESCGPCVKGYQCVPPSQSPTPVALPDLCGVPSQYQVMHKVMYQMNFSFEVVGMLKPSNFRTLGKLHEHSSNRTCDALDTFDISGNKLITSFNQGTVYLLYYSDPTINESGNYEIPDNDPFQKYLYRYLRFMIYQQLFEQSTDETFAQLKAKRDDAEHRSNVEYINARNYALSDTVYDVMDRIKRSYNRNNRFKIIGPTVR